MRTTSSESESTSLVMSLAREGVAGGVNELKRSAQSEMDCMIGLAVSWRIRSCPGQVPPQAGGKFCQGGARRAPETVPRDEIRGSFTLS